MSSTNSPTLIFFVPGIMGSSLFLQKKNTFGKLVKEIIWSENVTESVDALVKNSKFLTSEDIFPGEIISSINISDIKLFNIYETLLDFCYNQLIVKPQDKFIPFAYNWLADNQQNAKVFANFIREQDKKEGGESSFCLIAHSMGGILSHLMLSENQDIANKTKLFVQIACPFKGTAKAYNAIKSFPLVLNPGFDKIRQLLEDAVGEDTTKELKRSLEKIPSLYQLLPPKTEITLYDKNGKGYAALDPIIWENHLHKLIEKVNNVHEKLTQLETSSIPTKCIYSNQIKTATHYLIQSENTSQKVKLIKQFTSEILGDKTITVDSAIAYRHHQDLRLIKDGKVDHLGLCQNQNVYDIIRAEIEKLL